MSLKLNYLDTTTEDMFDINQIQHSRKGTSYQLKNMEVEVSWFGFFFTIMDSTVYQGLLEEHLRPFVKKIKLKRNWIPQQNNDPKHTSKSTKNWLKTKWRVLEWPSQSPDLNQKLRCCGLT